MLRVRTVATGVAGTPYYTNLHFAGEDQAAAQDAYDRVRAFWSAIALQLRTGLVIDVDNAVTQIDLSTGEPTGVLTVTDAGNVAGGGAAEALPPATQALVTFRTGQYVGGRAIQGRMFIPALTENVNDASGSLRGETASLITSAAQGLLDGDPGVGLSIYSRKNFISAAATSATCQTKWAVLRSRRD